MNLQERAEKILQKGYVCDHCLGRQFAQLLTGMSNEKRGEVMRKFIAMALDKGEVADVDEKNFRDIEFRNRDAEGEKGECVVCEGLFGELDEWTGKVMRGLQDYEFENFLLGTRLPDGLVKREEELWEEVGIEYCEEMKAEFNRELGKRLEEKMKKEVEFELPEIQVLVDVEKDKVKLDVNSICVYGEYQKTERGIPQTEWPSGKYEISLEEIIAPAFLRESDSPDEKFHGAGREDIDARCLGWRPFILELLEPKKRNLDLEKVKEEVNENPEVNVRNLQIVRRDKIEELKSWRPDKSYRALVELEEDVDEEELEELEELERTTLTQRTPQRVEHRRADRHRKRKVKELEWEKKGEKELEIVVKAEAGTYIKELISGDGGRTEPSVASVLGIEAECVELDVVEIHGKEELDFRAVNG
ncbi:MAG: tRNA pseudouridine(54/55) synthase Pus10 [Candidatus Aenigmatarchaeota archaeon]